MAKKKYALTEEHRAQLKPWADQWIANALSTKPMDDEDRAIMRRAIVGLYEAADLTPPPQHRIIFVRSPFIARFAGGFAAGVWANGNSGKAVVNPVTQPSIASDIFYATQAATAKTPEDVMEYPQQPDAACTSGKLWFSGIPINDIHTVAGVFGDVKYMLDCAQKAYSMWAGGNQWSGWVASLTFFRYVAKLEDYGVDYSKFDHYEKATIHGGPRIMHSDFCIVSDRPRILNVDESRRPHCDDGPFCQWADGTAMWAVHGARTPAWIIAEPEKITVQSIDEEQNAEIRRIMIKKMGYDRYILESGATVVHSDATGVLYRRDLPGEAMPLMAVHVLNKTPEWDGSLKEFVIPVHPELRPMLDDNQFGEPQELTAHNAVASTFGRKGEEYAPEIET